MTASLVMLLAALPAAGSTSLHAPLDIPLVLSGNFGELRPNHFHSGLDFKTRGVTGLPVLAAADGYISRITVAPSGFGRALYVTHPGLGLTTVYGHLEVFAPGIEKYVKDEQYRRETFSVDLEPAPGKILVNCGAEIARSGNTGSSGGPHLHMDVRDTATGDPIDPMIFFRNRIADNTPPRVRALSLVADGSRGTVSSPSTVVPKTGQLPVFTAWGSVIPAVKAYDHMDGTGNIFGVKHVTLTVDGDTVYRRTLDRFSFATTRAVNTLADYPRVASAGSWFLWTREPHMRPLAYMGGPLRGNGTIHIDEERDYRCRWTLADEHGNTRRCDFTIRGKRTLLPEARPRGDMLYPDAPNSYNASGVRVDIPAGTLYDPVRFTVTATPVPGAVSQRYTIGTPEVPLSGEYRIAIAIDTSAVSDPSKLYVARMSGAGARRYVDSSLKGDVMEATPNSFGDFAVVADTVAPSITPVGRDSWVKSRKITVKVSDGGSGIASWRGSIDGRWALFELDAKTGRLTCTHDPSRMGAWPPAEVSIEVTDRTGNASTRSYSMR